MVLIKWSRGVAIPICLFGSVAFGLPQSTFNVAGPVAQAQLDLFWLTFWLGVLVALIVGGVLVYVIWRFRHRGESAPPRQVHGNTTLEIVWTFFPVVILIVIAVPTVRTIFETESRVQPIGEDLMVRVTGYQWWWAFDYPDLGITTANELHIPAGRRVVLQLVSADVLHSFWVPSIAGKRDLIPNQDNQLWFVADRPGVYYGQCAELCLGAHAYMRFRVIVQSEEGFEAWVRGFQQAAEQPLSSDPQVVRGQQLYLQKGCAGCHAIAGTAVGQPGYPNLTNFGQRLTLAAGVLPNTPENLAAWLQDPQAIKPGNYMPDLGLSDDETAALVAYLLSLGRDGSQQATFGGTYGH